MKIPKLIIALTFVLVSTNMSAANDPITTTLSKLSSQGTTYINSLKLAKKLIPNEEIDALIETFVLIDKLACTAIDVDHYFDLYLYSKQTCMVEFEYQVIETQIYVILVKIKEIFQRYYENYQFQRAKNAFEDLLSDVEFFGISPGMIIDNEAYEELTKKSPKDILLDINKELKYLSEAMDSFTTKYRTMTIKQLQKEMRREKIKSYSIFTIET